MEILVHLHDCIVGRSRADLLRDDLSMAGIGGGDHAFVVNLELALAEEVLAAISVSARSTSGFEATLPRLTAAPEPHCSSKRIHVDFPLSANSREQFPVFVLGSARSGTSAIAHALLSTGKYAGSEEGHLLELAGQLRERVADFYEANGQEAYIGRNTLIQQVPSSYFNHAIAAIFVHLTQTMFPGGFWLDKTPKPEIVSIAPLFKEIWPNAKFIFMKRRGIKNVASRCRKFPSVEFRTHCHEWAACMQGWLSVRGVLASSSIELEQLLMARRPEDVGNTLRNFLELTDTETRKLVQSLATDRPQLTGERFGAVYGPSETGWSDHQVEEFQRLCGTMMDEYGYGHGDQYQCLDAG